MKTDIHPPYHKNAKILCACGAKFSAGSIVKSIQVEICSNCHPIYTGKQKLVDTAGRVERYQSMIKKSKEFKRVQAKQKNKK